MEVAKWNRFVKGRVQDAVTSGSALALASVAFLAVYREGFETVLFYKALFLTGGSVGAIPDRARHAGRRGAILVAVYVAINRFGVRFRSSRSSPSPAPSSTTWRSSSRGREQDLN